MDVLLGWPGGSWESTARLFGTLVGGYLLVMWVASVVWVYRDIRARTTDPASQLISVAIAVVFPLIGLPIYIILRPADTLTVAYDRQLEQEALLSELQTVSACPNCRRPVQEDFTVCAFCATTVKQACTRCGRQLRLSWRFCPYCSTPRAQAQSESRHAEDAPQPQPSRVSASREAAVEAIRRAAGRSNDNGPQEDDTPRARRASESGGGPAPRPRSRPRTDPER